MSTPEVEEVMALFEEVGEARDALAGYGTPDAAFNAASDLLDQKEATLRSRITALVASKAELVAEPSESAGHVSAAPPASYSPEDRAFYKFWYGHMLDELMQPPLANVAHSTARYIWDAALANATAGAGQQEEVHAAGASAQKLNREVARMLLDNDREGALKWARGLHATLGDDGWRVHADSASAQVPEGWKLVPVEPTPEMVHAATRAETRDGRALIYVGEPLHFIVTHVLVGYGLQDGWVGLSIRPYGVPGQDGSQHG